MNPKVFVSHASEDKERFVLGFATKLRAKGIDAWLDKWEMYPGDSLVDKIFEEGIKNAQAIIIVLSNYSVDKPWIREELNASMVKKINNGTKLIPVVLDDCKVPECLRSTLWERIKDITSYDNELNRIVMSIFGHGEKPPLGKPPSYTQTIIDLIPGLTKIDSLILKLSCEEAIKIGYPHINAVTIYEQLKAYEIPENDFNETIEILDNRGHIEATRVLGGAIPHYSITTYGFDEYARVYVTDYNRIVKAVVFQIVNHNAKNSSSIATSVMQPDMIIDHILDVLASKGLIKLSKTIGGGVNIFNVSPELKRLVN